VPHNFDAKLATSPIIIQSGNGVHFIQPVEGLVLEKERVFADLCENPSNRFHKFSEKLLTDNKSDPAHNPTFLSCMLRVPGSINSKNMREVGISSSSSASKNRVSGDSILQYQDGLELTDINNRNVLAILPDLICSSGMYQYIIPVHSLLR